MSLPYPLPPTPELRPARCQGGGHFDLVRQLAVLALACLVPLLAGCGDSPVEATEPVAQQYEASLDPTDRELILSILDKLETLEARVEQQATLLSQRLDSLAEAGLVLAPADVAADRPAGVGGGMTAKLDSLMALSAWMAEDMADQGSVTFCGNLGGQFGADLEQWTMLDGQAQGGAGVKPWDTGAAAEIELTQRYKFDLALGGALELGLEACWEFAPFRPDPPLPAAVSGASPTLLAATSPDPLVGTLLDVQSRLGLDGSRLERALMTGTDLLETGDVRRLVELGDVLPVPPGLRQPVVFLKGRVNDFDPVGLLCDGGGLGGPFGARIGDACELIRTNNLPELRPYVDIVGNFSNLCGQFNSVIGRRLIIDTDLPWEGSALNMRLFPSNWTVDC